MNVQFPSAKVGPLPRPTVAPAQLQEPAALRSESDLAAWFEQSGRPSLQERLIGTGHIPLKAQGLFFLNYLVETGVLDPAQFRVPTFFTLSPEELAREVAVPRSSDPSIRYQIQNDLVHSALLKQLLQNVCALIPGPSLMIRSLGLVEGGVFRSSAGALQSLHSIAKTPLAHIDACSYVIASAFSPYARLITSRLGCAAQVPGLILQEYVTEGAHIVFNIAVPGQIRGQITESSAAEAVSFCYNLESETLREHSPLHAKLIEPLVTLCRTLQSHGASAFEMEVVIDPKTLKTALLQHRFVESLQPQKFPDIRPKVEALSSIGTSTVEVEWVMILNSVDREAGLGAWLLQKQLVQMNKPFAVFANDTVISRMRADPAHRALCIDAAAIIEDNGAHSKFDVFEAHFQRILAEHHAVAMSSHFDQSALLSDAVELLTPSTRFWRESDRLLLSPMVYQFLDDPRTARFPLDALAVRLAKPLTIIADDFSGRGAIF